MTIQRGNFEIICDSCGHTEDLETKDFDDAREEANRLEEEENWTTLKRGNIYKHACSNCG